MRSQIDVLDGFSSMLKVAPFEANRQRYETWFKKQWTRRLGCFEAHRFLKLGERLVIGFIDGKATWATLFGALHLQKDGK